MLQSVEKQLLFLLTAKETIDTKEFISIFLERNYSSQSIRNLLSQLKKQNYIQSTARATYQITEEGKRFVQSINQKTSRYGKYWDGNWDMVLVEMPEAERKKRDQFRQQMFQLGFGLLYKSVYISPWVYEQELQDIIDRLEMDQWTTVFRGKMKQSLPAERAWNIWNLNQVDQVYHEKQHWFQSQFCPKAEKILSLKNDLAVFGLFLDLGEAIADITLNDPILPDELLPKQWAGRKIIRDFHGFLEQIAKEIPQQSTYYPFVKQYLSVSF